MPDFERLTDKMAIDLATTPEEKKFLTGYAKGKYQARIEVLIIFIVCLIAYLCYRLGV